MSTEYQDAHLAEVKPLVEKEEVIILNIFKAFVSSFSVPVATVHVFLVLTSCMERQMRNWWCNNSVLDICWCWGMTVLSIRHNWVLIIALVLCIFNADLLWTYIYILFFLNSYSSGFILNSSNWTNSSRSPYSCRLLSAEVHTLVYPQPFMEEQTCRESLYIALGSSGSEGMTAPSCLLRMPYDCSIKPSSAFCFVCLTLLCSFAFVFALFFSKSLPTASRVSVCLTLNDGAPTLYMFIANNSLEHSNKPLCFVSWTKAKTSLSLSPVIVILDMWWQFLLVFYTEIPHCFICYFQFFYSLPLFLSKHFRKLFPLMNVMKCLEKL